MKVKSYNNEAIVFQIFLKTIKTIYLYIVYFYKNINIFIYIFEDVFITDIKLSIKQGRQYSNDKRFSTE